LAQAELSNESLLGAGLRTRAAYDGSTARHTELVPVLRWFGQPGFVRSTQGVLEGGLRTALPGLPDLYAGLQLAYEPGRQRSEAAFLASHQVPDVAPAASWGGQLEWDHHFGRLPVTALLRLRRHSGGSGASQADLRLSAGLFQHGPLAMGLFTQGIWANAAATRSLYGLTPQQAPGSDLPAYQPDAGGWLTASVGLLFGVELAPRWSLVGSLETRRLQGSAARSPLVQQRASNSLSAGLAWHL
jgi:outer membrane scaffolding protein for murein synthesis (MipA/OmpV family)